MTAAARSALVVIGAALVDPDPATRRRRAAWLAGVDVAAWRCAGHRALVGGADDVGSIVAAMRDAGIGHSTTIDLVAAAIDAAHDDADRWREHAELLVAEAATERAGWDRDAAERRLHHAGAAFGRRPPPCATRRRDDARAGARAHKDRR